MLSAIKRNLYILSFKLMLNVALWDYGDLEYIFQCYSLQLLLFALRFV